jgi:hypothetical protein
MKGKLLCYKWAGYLYLVYGAQPCHVIYSGIIIIIIIIIVVVVVVFVVVCCLLCCTYTTASVLSQVHS